MNYLIVMVLGVIFLAGYATNDESIENNLKELKLFDSVKNPKFDADNWKRLTENSGLIVTGYVEETNYVVDEKKMHEKKASPDGIIPLPNLKEGVKGILIRFRVEELIYSEKDSQINESINIYVKDGYAPAIGKKIPSFASKIKYLVFLSPLEKADYVEGTTVIEPLDLSKGSFDFDYKSAFKVTEKANGYFDLSKLNEHIVDEVRETVEKMK